MAITLGSNIASLGGQRQLAKTSGELGTVFERLSSGQRINKASDDAAGLAIADSLNAQCRIYNQGVRNLSDGLSLLSIADSAIENLSDIVIRLEELAEQAANGVYTNKQRKAMDDEAQALGQEFFRVTKSTEFNGQRMFTGEFGGVNLQGGVGNGAVLAAGVGGAIGKGSFGAGVAYQMESLQSRALALGDLNGDGILDMVSGGVGAGGGATTVRLGLGEGIFGSASSYQSSSTNALALEDFNSDGILDMVSAGAGLEMLVRLGLGNGSFGTAHTYDPGIGEVFSVVVGDMNGDGKNDIVSCGYYYSFPSSEGRLSIMFGNADGTFGTANIHQLSDDSVSAVAIGDLNGDGILDVATADYDYTAVRLGRGDGTFSTSVSYLNGFGGYLASITFGDLNGDSVLDLVKSAYGKTSVRLGAGDGTFGAQAIYQIGSGGPGTASRAELGDLNGDGFLDLVGSSYDSSFLYGGVITIRLGAGNGSFGAVATYQTGTYGESLATLGDVDGDGVLDIAATGASGGGIALVFLADTRDGIAPLLPFSLSTLAGARQALPVFQRKREQLAEQRGEIGAFQSRIDIARSILEVSSENFRAAESRIRDADIAEESSRLVRLNILQQAASSILAQANQQPALALQLISVR